MPLVDVIEVYIEMKTVAYRRNVQQWTELKHESEYYKLFGAARHGTDKPAIIQPTKVTQTAFCKKFSFERREEITGLRKIDFTNCCDRERLMSEFDVVTCHRVSCDAYLGHHHQIFHP